MHAQFIPSANVMDTEMMAAAAAAAHHHDHPHQFGLFPDPMLENNPAPWNHTVPTNIPWFQTRSPFPQGDFRLDETDGRRAFISKRKGPVLEGDTLPNKQFISEEVMSARMNQLHISQGNSSAPLGMGVAHTHRSVPEPGTSHRAVSTSSWNSSSPRMNSDIADRSPTNSLESKPESMIVLAPEIAKIEEQSLLPRSILERLKKPSMEVVLWKPPGGLVDHLIRASMCKSPSDTEAEEAFRKRSRPVQTQDHRIFDEVGRNGIARTSTSSEEKICDATESDEEMNI